ncbi:MAG: uracil-DNA glycosylase family protein [Exilibacterium sp.]
MSTDIPLVDVLNQVRSCRVCEHALPLGANPVLRASASARVLIVGQAPGTRVHATGIPWNDPSGDRLREWMGLDRDIFYNEVNIAIVPMGFCYPGRGRSGDLPPRKECAPMWHEKIMAGLNQLELILLVGSYAQAHYLPGKFSSLTERVKAWRQYTPRYLPLVHPSPRNRLWLKNNPWFEREVVPYLRKRVRQLLM